MDEAQGYADRVNEKEPGAARFATGLAGTWEQSIYVRTTYWDGRIWSEVSINNYETTGFLSLDQCLHLLEANENRLPQFEPNQDRFIKKANEINQTLQNNEVPVGDRAGFMAALLLALAQDGNLRLHAEPSRLIREINGLIKDMLQNVGKGEFADVIGLRPPATKKNHRKFRRAIVDTLQHLREMNIRSAINSGTDALGQFYEIFLKYANGAKEMGVVLTPRHITRFAVDVVGVSPHDRVLDPTCGTGGFLISAMESIRERNPGHYDDFRCKGLFGVEQRDDVYGLAVVNMIFRGDGKSSIHDGNCFDHEFWLRDGEILITPPDEGHPEGAQRPFSRVLMNPPFKLKDPETAFVDYALRHTREKGILFAVLPAVVIAGKKHRNWRKELLDRHTVKACIKFDKSLFYPVAEQTYGLIIEAHRPHDLSGDVFLSCLFDDDHRLRRSKMLAKHDFRDNLEEMTETVRRFMLGRPVDEALPQVQRVTTLDPDGGCVFAPEAYIEPGSVPVPPVSAAYRVIEAEASARRAALSRHPVDFVSRTAPFSLREFMANELSAPLHALKDHPPGQIPVITSTCRDNGVAGRLDVPDEHCIENCITISTTHNTRPCEAFWHPYRFSAVSGLVIIIRPTEDLLLHPLAIAYLCEAITTGNAWRYSYARPVKLDELQVEVPVMNDGKPDIVAMADIVQRHMS